MTAGGDEDFPPNPEAGACYAKCLLPAQYENYTEQVQIRPEGKRLSTVPAVFEATTERVVTRDESKRLEIVPAIYEEVTEQVVVKPASTRLEAVAAIYADESETVQVAPESTRWERGKADASCLSQNPEDCKVWCLVKVPARFETVTKRVLKTPAATREVAIPAEYKTVTRRVVKTPAATREVVIPAEYGTITKSVLKTPASVREEVIPAESRTVTRTRQVRASGMTEWRKVLCAADVTVARILAIQRALREKGYEPGPLDNVLGPLTKTALVKYQRDHKLPEGSLDLETLTSLGVK